MHNEECGESLENRKRVTVGPLGCRTTGSRKGPDARLSTNWMGFHSEDRPRDWSPTEHQSSAASVSRERG